MIRKITTLENSVKVEYGQNEREVLTKLEDELVDYMIENGYEQMAVEYEVKPFNSHTRQITVSCEVEKK